MVREVHRGGFRPREAIDAGFKALLFELSHFGRVGEQLRVLRLCMVMVSFAPLFLLVAIRGNNVLADRWMWLICSLLIAVPLAFVLVRMLLVWQSDASEEIVVGEAEDSRSHVLGYLFATMLPFYRSSIDQWRDLIALAVALSFILLLFWSLRWHYVNWLLLVLGYRVYTVTPPADPGGLGRRTPWVVITRRVRPLAGERFYAKRVSATVCWETGA
jgi:hypothetical protein